MSVDIKEALAFFDPMRVESVLDLSEWRALVDILEAARRVAEADEVWWCRVQMDLAALDGRPHWCRGMGHDGCGDALLLPAEEEK